MSQFKECDIRGLTGSEITADLAFGLGRCFGALSQDLRPVSVGRDARPSSLELAQAVMQGLIATGRDVKDWGLVPTPALTWFTVREASDAIMVTASHNPPEYNGFKLVLKGRPVYGDRLLAIERALLAPPLSLGTGRVHEERILDAYIQRLTALCQDQGWCPSRPVRVVVDPGNGCAALSGSRVLRAVGFEVQEIFSEVDGTFPNRDPNPAKPGVLSELGQRVRDWKADFGVGFDGDGDRACFVDDQGRALDPEQAILCLLEPILTRPETVVYDAKCSMIVPQYVRSRGGTPLMERSGYAFIRNTVERQGAVFAGELSGHHFFRVLGGADDATFSACVFGSMVSRLDLPLSQHIASFPKAHITPDLRIRWDADQAQRLLDRLKTHFLNTAGVSVLDGVRVEFEEGWALLRRSVTEPVITLRFEGKDEPGLRTVIQRILTVVPEMDLEVRKRL